MRVDGTFIVGPPKSDAGVRDVAIPPHLVPLVKSHLKDLTAPGRDALLFPAAADDNLHVAPGRATRCATRPGRPPVAKTSAGTTCATPARCSLPRRVFIVIVFTAEQLGTIPTANLSEPVQIVAGVLAGVGIGVVAALLGVAGGELLIPTFVLLYGVDTKLAGSLSLLVSLPTMLVAFFRYSRDQAFSVLADSKRFVVAMAAGSVTGALVSGLLLGIVLEAVLVPLLTALLLYSAVKVWRHA